jgi:hypothetical protein
MSDNPVPPDLAVAFDEAVDALSYWDRGGPEPLIGYEGQPHKVSAIAGLAAAYGIAGGNAPDNIYAAVCDMAEAFRGGQEGNGRDCTGPTDHSYRRVAECLGRLYDARVAHYNRRAEIRNPAP